MELTFNDVKTKGLLKEVIIELITDKRDLFYEIIMEALEEIALAKEKRGQARINYFAGPKHQNGSSP
jgi:hypothetical protein